jgi:hypothetical protein
MEAITLHSISRASDDALRLWALTSAQYPKKHNLVLNVATTAIIEAISSLALNARRAMEVLPTRRKYPLSQPRWLWEPSTNDGVTRELRDALNRIIHAQKLQVGFEELPEKLAVIDEGALIVPYIQVQTDRRNLAFVDPFALAHSFLYDVLPELEAYRQEHSNGQFH